jgi:hypothetical protein
VERERGREETETGGLCNNGIFTSPRDVKACFQSFGGAKELLKNEVFTGEPQL